MTSGTGPTDAELAAAVCEGDESAFETLFERHRTQVGIIAGRFFQQREVIEDIVQECFVKAYFALKDFSDKQDGSMTRWLAKIAFNTCYDELRRRRRKPESLLSELTDGETQIISELIAGPGAASLESDAVTRDLTNKLFSHLSAEDRLVLVLLDVEGLSVAEIGKLMGWSAAKVKIRIFRARNDLRRILKRFL
ncbi:MAG: RNA polymerase sigma factor [Pyrinomonadaceae bacterium]